MIRLRISIIGFHDRCVCHISDLQESFDHVPHWLADVDRYGNLNSNKLLVGNKADLSGKREVDDTVGKVMTSYLNLIELILS